MKESDGQRHQTKSRFRLKTQDGLISVDWTVSVWLTFLAATNDWTATTQTSDGWKLYADRVVVANGIPHQRVHGRFPLIVEDARACALCCERAAGAGRCPVPACVSWFLDYWWRSST